MNYCLRCGHEREPRRLKWCGLCAPIVAQEYVRAYQRDRYDRLQSKRDVPCLRCGLPRGPRRQKWCAECAAEVVREQHDAAMKRYRAKRPELVRLWNRQAYERRKARAA